MEDLNEIQPEPHILTISTEEITVSPLKFGQFGAFARTIKPVIGSINELLETDTSDTHFAMQIAELLANHSEDVLKAVAIAIDKPESWVSDLDMAQAIELVQAVIEVNMDFFGQRLVPHFNQAIQHLGTRLGGSMSVSV